MKKVATVRCASVWILCIAIAGTSACSEKGPAPPSSSVVARVAALGTDASTVDGGTPRDAGTAELGVSDGGPETPDAQPTATHQWIRLAPTGGSPAPRENHSAAYAPGSNRMIVFGGANVSQLPRFGDLWVLTNANGLGGPPSWVQLDAGVGPSPREGHASGYDVVKDKLMIYAGRSCDTTQCSWPTDVWVLSNASGVSGPPTWSQLSPTGGPPGPRWSMASAYDPSSNRFIVQAGQDASGGSGVSFPNDVWVLTNANGQGGTPAWIQLTPSGGPPINRALQSSVYDAVANRLVIFGGSPFGFGTLTDLWALDNANGLAAGPTTWTPLKPIGVSPQAGFASWAVLDPITGRMIIFGGGAQTGSLSNETWVFSNTAWSQVATVGPMPEARYIHTTVFDPTHNRLIAFGGRTRSSGDVNDVWVLPGANGNPDDTTPPPIVDGQPCTSDGDCASGLCVDSVCCASACGGNNPDDCQACSVGAGATTNGTCARLLAGHVCRATAGACDVPETCTDSSASCPPDVFAPAGAICHVASNLCESTVACSGSDVVCPNFTILPTGAKCASVSVPQTSNPKTPIDFFGGTATVGGVSITFDSIAAPFQLSVEALGSGPPPPPGYEIFGKPGYWKIEGTPSTAYVAPQVCIHYNPTGVPPGTECNLLFEHDAGSGFQNITALSKTCDRTGHTCAGGTTCPIANVICGNATAHFSPFAIVQPVSGPPVVTVPTNITAEATGPTGARVSFTATASDVGDGPLVPTCTPASGALFPMATTTVTCTATNSAGLSASKSFSIIVRDTTGPAWSGVPATINAFATATTGAKVSYAPPKATDVVDGARAVTCTPASGSRFPVNKTTVTCKATDTLGNQSTAAFSVWVSYQAPTDGTFLLIPIRSNGNSIFPIGPRPLPVRFRLTGASAGITNLVAKFAAMKISSSIQGTANDVSDETVSDTGSTFG